MLVSLVGFAFSALNLLTLKSYRGLIAYVCHNCIV